MTEQVDHGYSMSKALELLHKELSTELEAHERTNTRNGLRDILGCFHHNSVRALWHWPSLVISLIVTLLLLVSYGFMDNHGRSENIWVVIEAGFIIFFIVLNCFITINSASKEKKEFSRILKEVLKNIASCARYNLWTNSHFLSLESPQSPCYTLQWTIRDGQVYNVPAPLLVKGDVILIRPGHAAPARCKLIQVSGDISHEQILDGGEVYSPNGNEGSRNFTSPQNRVPLQPLRYVLLETPYLKVLRQILNDSPRPPSSLEHEKFEIFNLWIERRILPILLIITSVVNVIRYLYMRGHVGHWSEVIILLQLHTILPLLPLLLPMMWLILNCYGEARVFTSFEAAKGTKSLSENSYDTDSSISADEVRIDLQWRQILSWFQAIITGEAQTVSRKINITHILGSVTTLCCVDKKGILSYPNPTPEKVFFLRNGKKDLQHQISEYDKDGLEARKERERRRYTDTSQRHVEVLDITSNPKKALVHFDDPFWKNYLSSLKPLKFDRNYVTKEESSSNFFFCDNCFLSSLLQGLNILANTCNLDTVRWYSKFTDHVAYAGLENQETVAVVNRRCLCPLAKEIGFSETALDIFKMEKILGVYRQVSAELTTKERLQRAKSFVQHKIPMPNMVSVVLKEKASGSCQVLSQGTADILLSCCSDLWDGDDLEPLTATDRKRILDFYQRASIGAYCTAFSYCPVRQNLVSSIDDVYIELPNDGVASYLTDNIQPNLIEPDLDPLKSENLGVWENPKSFSVESLFESSTMKSEEESVNTARTVVAQRNQVFIGMVTMQYQARQDFIQLIDKLEGACIRFVHFSQENEARSRVFAEKMGLEAGWNCHISLRSEKQYLSGTSSAQETSQMDLAHRSTSKYTSRRSTDSGCKGAHPDLLYMNKCLDESSKSQSQSAPSIFHLASSQVKFEKNVKTALVSPRPAKRGSNTHVNIEDEFTPLHQKSEESEVVFDYDLTDYQTWVSDEDLSRQASSYITENTEDSLTGVLDNRPSMLTMLVFTLTLYSIFIIQAKLPRGIENIRPHLNSIDNVPLLVNLFTDCSTDTTCEMVNIMQEHGEVVLCVGSSANMQNTPIFLKADCSIGLEPLCPQVCMGQAAVPFQWDKTLLTPLQLASSLLSVVCPLHINQEDNISLIHLIAESRAHLMSTRNCFFFIMCCSLSVSFAQVLASFSPLPPVLSAHHVLWLVLFVIPLLGTTMLGNLVDARVMSLATRKNANHISKEMILQFMGYNVLRFLLPVLAGLFCYSLTLHSFCQTLPSNGNSTACGIFDFLYDPPSSDRTWYDKFSGGLVLAQNIFLFLLLLYFEIISLSFVHWTDHLWQQFPATNKMWLITTPVLLCCQVLFCVCDVYIRTKSAVHSMSLSEVHPAVWAVGLTFPVFMVVINELLKHREIKLAVRYQKRARLDFGTKLGMNSPF